MKQEFNLSKLRKKGYKFLSVFAFVGNCLFPFCILCETGNEISVTALWVNPKEKQVFSYYMCKKCSEEFFGLSTHDQESIAAKVIEKKIMALPHIEGRYKFCGDNDEKSK